MLVERDSQIARRFNLSLLDATDSCVGRGDYSQKIITLRLVGEIVKKLRVQG